MNKITKTLILAFLLLLTPALAMAGEEYVSWTSIETTMDGYNSISSRTVFGEGGGSGIAYVSSTLALKIPEGSNMISINVRSGTESIDSSTTTINVSGTIVGGAYLNIAMTPRKKDLFAGNSGAIGRAVEYCTGTITPIYNMELIHNGTEALLTASPAAYHITSATLSEDTTTASRYSLYKWLQYPPNITSYGTFNFPIGENNWMLIQCTIPADCGTTGRYALQTCVTVQFSRHRFVQR